MNPKEFIKNRLREIYETVKSINIKYEFREHEDTHLIEITPVSEFNDNSRYHELERELLFDFNDQYFPSTILFVSEDSLNRVAIPEFSLKMIREEFSIKIDKNAVEHVWGFNFTPIKLSAGENNFALAA
jgi:hypothetical protein